MLEQRQKEIEQQYQYYNILLFSPLVSILSLICSFFKGLFKATRELSKLSSRTPLSPWVNFDWFLHLKSQINLSSDSNEFQQFEQAHQESLQSMMQRQEMVINLKT